MLKFTGEVRKEYLPRLFDSNGEWVADGEMYDSLEDAENHAKAMVSEFIEETEDAGYATIEVIYGPVYEYVGEEEESV